MSSASSLRAFLIVGSAFAGGLICGAQVVREAVAGVWADYAGLDTLARALTIIDRRYIEPVEPAMLAHAAVKGMTVPLDPYSTYHDPDEWRAMTETVESTGTGIGVELDRDGTHIRLARVIPGAPGDLAGLRVGMRIEQVDDHTVETVSQAQAHIHGTTGEPVRLRGTDLDGTPFDRVVVRDTFEDIRIDGGPLPHELYYIRIGRFTRGTGTRLEQQANRMPPGTRGLVLDVRGNPGGLLSEAGIVADRFLGSGLVVETVARDGVVDGTIETTDQPGDLDLPIAVLIDQRSASAAEVLAGALAARERATLVGTRSYGKGSVQSIIEFEDGGALRLTTAAYRLSNGQLIDAENPLIPDIPVEVGSPRGARSRIETVLRAQAPDATTLAEWLADLNTLEEPNVDPDAPAPIPLGANPAAYVGRDPVLDAAIATLRP